MKISLDIPLTIVRRLRKGSRMMRLADEATTTAPLPGVPRSSPDDRVTVSDWRWKMDETCGWILVAVG